MTSPHLGSREMAATDFGHFSPRQNASAELSRTQVARDPSFGLPHPKVCFAASTERGCQCSSSRQFGDNFAYTAAEPGSDSLLFAVSMPAYSRACAPPDKVEGEFQGCSRVVSQSPHAVSRQLGSLRPFAMGTSHCREGLQAPVLLPAPSLSAHSTLSNDRSFGVDLKGGNGFSFRQASDRASTGRSLDNGLLLQVLCGQKEGGGMRPILDLRQLNKHLRKINFKMLTTESLLNTARAGDWSCSIDINDAFLHVPIYPPHRKFLRFAFEGKGYQYMVLPFGLRLSPRTFVKCTMVALRPLHTQGLRVSSFIDDWLLTATPRSK